MRKMIRGIAAVLAVSALMAGSAFAADKLVVKDAAGTTNVFAVTDTGAVNAAGSLAWDSANKRLGVGTTTPVSMLHLSTQGNGTITFESVGTSGEKGLLSFKKANGTVGNTTAVVTGDFLAQFGLQGATGLNTFDTNRRIFQIEATENWSTTAGGFGYRFYTRPNGSLGVPIERLTVSHNGNVGIGAATPTSKLQVVGLPEYADNAAAIAGGLTAGAFYRTSTGVLMVVF